MVIGGAGSGPSRLRLRLRLKWLSRRFEEVVVVVEEVLDIMIVHHMLGAKNQKLFRAQTSE